MLAVKQELNLYIIQYLQENIVQEEWKKWFHCRCMPLLQTIPQSDQQPLLNIIIQCHMEHISYHKGGPEIYFRHTNVGTKIQKYKSLISQAKQL